MIQVCLEGGVGIGVGDRPLDTLLLMWEMSLTDWTSCGQDLGVLFSISDSITRRPRVAVIFSRSAVPMASPFVLLVVLIALAAVPVARGQDHESAPPVESGDDDTSPSGFQLTPDEAVRQALQRSNVVRAIRSEANAARSAYRRVRSARLPALSALASYTRLSDNIPEIAFDTDFVPGLDTTFTLAPAVLDRYYSEVTIEQPLFTGFELHHQIRAARYRADAADLEAKQREADLAFEVRRAYWSLFEARAAVDAASQAVRQAEEHLENVLNFRDAGAALESDVLAARTRALDVRLQLAEAEDAASLAQFELNRLLDRSLDTHIELAPNLDELSGVAPELGPSLDEALEANAGLAALNAEVQALESMLRSSEGSWFPDIALNGRLVYARPNQYFFMDQDEFKPTWEAGAVFRWSIWSGGERSARVQEARARLEAARARLEEARDQMALEVNQRVLAVERAGLRVQVSEEHVEAATEAVRVTRQQYAQGAALNSDVLDAERALQTALARRAQAIADLAMARAALLRSTGRIW